MAVLLITIGSLLFVAIAATFRARDPHHEFMFCLVQLLGDEHRISSEHKKVANPDRAA